MQDAHAEDTAFIRMAPLTLLLHLMLMVTAASAGYHYSYYYRFYGGSLTFTPKGKNSDGTYEVELRDKQTTYNCHANSYSCLSGNCGLQILSTRTVVARNSYGLSWCQQEVKTLKKLNSNRPFTIRYPTQYSISWGYGYWVSNTRSSMATWRMMAHVDLGTRSDTGESNRSPITTMLPILRVPRNCPRSFSMTVFDPDGDHVRCRVPTAPSTYECGLCGLPSGFSLDQNSCSLRYTHGGSTGYNPIELVVEDFPNKEVLLSYSDGSNTLKKPLSARRRKRAVNFTPTTTAAPMTTTAFPTTTTAALTTTTAFPTTTTAAPTTTTAALTTTTAFPTTTTAAPTTTTAFPTTTTAAPTTTTAAPTTTTTAPTTTTTAPTTTTTAPTTTTTAPTTTTPAPTTTTTAPTTTTTAPTTTTTAPTTTTTAPTTTTPAPTTTTTAAITTTTIAPTTTTVAPTTTTPAPTTTTPAPTTTTPAPTTTTAVATTTTYPESFTPLSKLPLQFSIFVDSHNAPSCLDGDYFPVFLAPTPVNGVNLPAFVNQTFEITVRSKAQYTTVYDLIVTGPSGISKQQVSTGHHIIKWTPTDNELNDHFPICFVSEARDGYNRVYQSELRCVTADVGHHEATVTCNETTITVEVEKNYLIRRNEDNLHLNDFTDSSCNLTRHSNATHLVAVMSLSTCGTLIEEDDDNIIFKNEITSADPSEIISRQHDVEIAFSCAYPKRTNLTLGFTHKNPYAFRETGFGAFTFEFEFFESQRFRKQVDASTYPVEVYLKQMIFMQIEATSSIPNTELFVESCRATPYDNPNSRISYTIIENGCVKDKTVQVYPSSKAQFRFGMEAFEFIGAHEQVYITCVVILCETGVSGTRCSQGCISSGAHRSKREAAAQTKSHSISQGPLHLVKTTDSQASGLSLNLGMNLIFIVGCLLACGVVIYRSRRSKAKYQPLPTSETD